MAEQDPEQGVDSLNGAPEFSPVLNADSLYGGEVLYAREALYSKNGKYRVYMQDDGNLVIYRTDTWAPIWSSNTWDPPNPTMQLRLSIGGSLTVHGKFHMGYRLKKKLVAYNPWTGWVIKWSVVAYKTTLYAQYSSGTTGAPVLVMQDDGNLVLYDTDTWKAVWASNSWQG